jgi:hypothetical protein
LLFACSEAFRSTRIRAIFLDAIRLASLKRFARLCFSKMKEFGEKLDGVEYAKRPGSYGVLIENGRVGVVKSEGYENRRGARIFLFERREKIHGQRMSFLPRPARRRIGRQRQTRINLDCGRRIRPNASRMLPLDRRARITKVINEKSLE